jgi:hypothetical protein
VCPSTALYSNGSISIEFELLCGVEDYVARIRERLLVAPNIVEERYIIRPLIPNLGIAGGQHHGFVSRFIAREPCPAVIELRP